MSSANRLNNIDALRGIAALLVVWQHSSELFNSIPEVAAHGSALANMAWSYDFGRIGVVCFFLISGFVIPFSFSNGHEALRTFTIRRFFRLYPAYWLSIALVIIAGFLISGRVFDTGTVIANTSMLQKFFGEPHMLGLYWTLQVEIVFYALCAGLFALGVLHKLWFQMFACIGSLLLSMLLSVLQKQVDGFENLDSEFVYLPYAISIMFSGTLLRSLLLARPEGGTQWYLLLAAPLLVFIQPLLILLFHFGGTDLIGEPQRFFYGHTLGGVLFVLGFYLLRFNSSVLLYLGAVSYSVYLFHPVAMDIVHWFIGQQWGTVLSGQHLSFYILLVSALTVLMAGLSYRFVEKPSIDLGRRLSSH